MNINARNYAAALSVLGADVESAVLELAEAAPSLLPKVRRALYQDERTPKLRNVGGRQPNFVLVWRTYPRYVCVMHAVDLLTTAVDDAALVAYLEAKFPDLNPQELVC